MDSKQITGVVLLCCFIYVAGYKECTETGKINSVKVNNVQLKPNGTGVAKLTRGKNASLEIEFTTGKTSKSSTSECYGVIRGVPVPFPVSSNGCPFLSSSSCKGNDCCPLKPQVAYTFKTDIFVKTIYPKIKLVIEWKEMGDDRKPMFCLLLPAMIV